MNHESRLELIKSSAIKLQKKYLTKQDLEVTMEHANDYSDCLMQIFPDLSRAWNDIKTEPCFMVQTE
jgi:hypothetical protein